MIPIAKLNIEQAHDGDEELYIVVNAYGEIVYEAYTYEDCEVFVESA